MSSPLIKAALKNLRMKTLRNGPAQNSGPAAAATAASRAGPPFDDDIAPGQSESKAPAQKVDAEQEKRKVPAPSNAAVAKEGRLPVKKEMESKREEAVDYQDLEGAAKAKGEGFNRTPPDLLKGADAELKRRQQGR